MTSDAPSDNLVRRLVALGEPATEPAALDEHVSPEDLALFVSGQWPAGAEPSPAAHLAQCNICRHWAAELLKDEAEQASAKMILKPRRPWLAISRHAWLATAALVLLLVSVAGVLWPWGGAFSEQTAYAQAKEQLLAGQFEQARQTIERAREQGIDSDRLRSLSAQAWREFPHPLALAWAGKLSDFGYEAGGIVARGATSLAAAGNAAAGRQLGSQPSADVELLLNRAHLALSRGDVAVAERDLSAAAAIAPDQPLVWLGTGLAQFLDDDFPAAEAAFRKVLELDPQNLPAAMNLAMALEEQDRAPQAIAQWRTVLADPRLTSDERAKIAAAVAILEGHLR